MAEEEFEIDVYGDAEGGQDQNQANADEYSNDHQQDDGMGAEGQEEGGNDYNDQDNQHHMDDHDGEQNGSAPPAPQQGVKRKQEPDDRPIDPNATTALLLADMQWYNTEDEIRGWVNAAACEDELKDITFSEHKVNGKSKGQAYIEFASPQAATAAKRSIDKMHFDGAGQRRPTISFHSPNVNPFKTLPKDAPQRSTRDSSQGRGAPAGPNFHSGPPVNNFQAGGGGGGGGGGGFQGNFRGRGGGYARGGVMRGGFNQNYGNSNMNAFNNNMGFNNGMGGGGFNRGGMGGGFNNRGGPNMRGRGGMNAMMGGGPAGMMGGPMGMGGMGMPAMGMMGGMGAMGGFNGMPGQFNPGFFGGNPGGGGNYGGGNNQSGDWGNPHGTKRPRGE